MSLVHDGNRRDFLRQLGIASLGTLGLGCPRSMEEKRIQGTALETLKQLHHDLAEVARQNLNPVEDVAAFYHFRSRELFLSAGEQHFWRRSHPPGSVIKLVTAYALLASGWRDETYTCRGHHQDDFGTLRHCWLRRGHGPMRLRTALAMSCNAWFLEQTQSLSSEAWLSALQRFVPFTHLDFPRGQRRGFYDVVPLRLTPKELREVALGISPLHQMSAASLLGLVSLIASRGHQQPFAKNTDATFASAQSPLERHALEPVAEGMLETVRSGTLRGILQGDDVAAKTGTAPKNATSASRALIVGYFPAQNPAFSFVVIKNTGQGAADAGPPANALLAAVRRKGILF